MTDQPAPIELEMGYSPVEFARVLPRAMRDWQVSGQSTHWSVSDRAGMQLATIALDPRPERSIGALRVPVSRVRITFVDAAPEQMAELMRRFERGFHRGGG
ncbi:MAG: hypothetical protein KDI82_11925 [Gammaproteobacteria bacterium]|nr:hypothetical protein [Gammaproteobacteria bacterium]